MPGQGGGGSTYPGSPYSKEYAELQETNLELLAQIEKLTTALEFYKSEKNYENSIPLVGTWEPEAVYHVSPIDQDRGKKAREAITSPPPSSEAIKFLVDAVKFYASEDSWEDMSDESVYEPMPVIEDNGSLAKEALSKCRAEGLIS